MSKTIFAFDLYGTLLSTASIAAALTEFHGPEIAESIAAVWRKYQLEYTWRSNNMKRYENFDILTRKSLQHTLEEHRVTMNPEQIDSVMQAYDNLSAFKDVVPALAKLGGMPNIECVVFSNGTQKMIDNSIKGSKDLTPISGVFSRLISVDHLQSFKPAPEVYKYLANCVGLSGGESKIWLVSCNPFDIVGARAVGMNAVWVDRLGNGWQDKLGLEPNAIINGLEDLEPLAGGQ